MKLLEWKRLQKMPFLVKCVRQVWKFDFLVFIANFCDLVVIEI